MARDFMASMLDELMGRERNVEPEKRRGISFQDDDICKYFLAGFCPHELFVNTKADLGPCKKVHDEKYKDLYQKSTSFKKLGYEEEFYAFLRDLSHDMDRKIKRANERVVLTNKPLPSGKSEESNEQRDNAKQELNKKINQLIAEANELGATGDSDAAEAKMRELEKLKLEKRNLLELGLDIPTSSILSIERKLEVCQVCGAYLVIGDAQQRIEDHLGGKQHSGFALVRRTLQEVDDEKKRQREERAKLSPARNNDDYRDSRRTNGNRYLISTESAHGSRHRYDERDRDRNYSRQRRYGRSPSPRRRRRHRSGSDADSDDDGRKRGRDDRRKQNRSPPAERSRSRDRSQRRSPARKSTAEPRNGSDSQKEPSRSSHRGADDKKQQRRDYEEDERSNGRKSPASSRSSGSLRKASTVQDRSPSNRRGGHASRDIS